MLDKKIQIKYKRNFLIVLIILAIGICAYIYYTDSSTLEKSLSHVNGNPLTFNYESGFYNHELEIVISKDIELPLGTEIYYTLNGDDPTNKSTLYSNSIKLELDEKETKVIPLKTRIYFKEEYSDVYQQTYVIDKNVESRFTLPVISITSDSYNLYDYYKGLMVPGYWYEHFKKQTTNPNAYIRGNYNNGWTRDANVILFDKNGDTLLNQNVGISISGRTSAELEVKSLTLRSDYGDKKNFLLDLISKNSTSSKVSLGYNYKSLNLKSGSQDRIKSNIRASLINRLAYESNFYGGTTTNRAIVYLNGDFYGIFDIEEPYSNSTLAKKFSLDEGSNIKKYKGGEKECFTKAGILEILENDLNIPENKIKLEKNVDVDNMILYYSIELLINNLDWIHANYGIWKYDGTISESNIYSDGRYRFMLFDVDGTYYSPNDHTSSIDKFKSLTNENTSLFMNILSVKEYRDKFIITVSDLLNTSFEKEHIYTIIDEEYAKIENENKKYYSQKMNDKWSENIKKIKEGVDYMDKNLINDIAELYNLSEKYTFNLKVNDGIKVYWNNMEFYGNSDKSSYSNQYYKGVNFKINFEEYPGYKFDYWLVNGKKYYNKELEIKDELIENDKINIEIFTKRDNDKSLIISEINAKDDSDWIKLLNIGQNSINIGNYYITDNKNKPLKSQLPDIELKPNESIILNGNKNYYAVGDYICNFNLSVNETLYLYNSEKNIIEDSIVIPRMSSIETYGRYLNSNTFMFFNNENNKRKLSTY